MRKRPVFVNFSERVDSVWNKVTTKKRRVDPTISPSQELKIWLLFDIVLNTSFQFILSTKILYIDHFGSHSCFFLLSLAFFSPFKLQVRMNVPHV
jgi:hypothetical protein